MLKESLTGYSSKSTKIKPVKNQEIEGWRKNQELQESLLPALQGTTPFRVSTRSDLHKQPKYPKSQQSLSFLYPDSGNGIWSPNRNKSFFELTPFENSSKVYRNSITNRSDWSFSERNNEKPFLDCKDSKLYRSTLSVSEEKSEGPGFLFKKRFSQRLLMKDADEFTKEFKNDSESEKSYKSRLNKNQSGNSGQFEIDKVLGFNKRDREQKFNLIYGNDLDVIEKLENYKTGKKVKRISNLGDIFHENIDEDFVVNEETENADCLSADSSSSSKRISENFEKNFNSAKKKYRIAINGIKGDKDRKESSEELSEIKIRDYENEIGNTQSIEKFSDSKRLVKFQPNLNIRKQVSIIQNKDEKIQENLQETENLKTKTVQQTLKSSKTAPIKAQIGPSKILKSQVSSIVSTNKSPKLEGLTKKYNSQKNFKTPKKKIQKKSTKLQRRGTTNTDSKFQTKTTFKSTTINESTDKSLYQTSDFPSPLSVLGNSSNEKLSPLYTLAESDFSEKQKVFFSNRKKTADPSKGETDNTEKFPLIRQKLMRETTISSYRLKQQKSKNFSLKSPKLRVFDSELDNNNNFSEQVSAVDKFIKNYSNSMLASLHVMIVNLTSSLEKLASDKKKLNLRNVKNFDGLYPELDSSSRREKINKRMKIELNICINMGRDFNDTGSGKAINFLMSKIKKSIISEGIKKEMLDFLQNYKGVYDKNEIEKSLKEILNNKLQQCRKVPEQPKKFSYPKSQPIEPIPEISKETKENSPKTEKIPQVTKKTEETTETLESQNAIYKSDKTKIQTNEFEGLNLDKASPNDTIWKELACMNLGKIWGSCVFSSKINDSYLPTSKDTFNNSSSQNIPNSQHEDFPEPDQDLANLASALKKLNFFKLKENSEDFKDNEKFKLIIQSLSEVDPSQLASFEKTRIQKYLKKIDFLKNKPKVEISTKLAKSFSNLPKSRLSYNNKSPK